MIILYAEDDPEDLDTFQDIINLIDPQIKIFHARNGSELFDILDNSVILPDYVFLDINMPVLDGRECLKKIRSDKRFRSVPVVIYTTSNRPEDIDDLKKLGAYQYFVKPNTFKEAVEGLGKFFRSEAGQR
jgi:CheY-like chemotaxis protein